MSTMIDLIYTSGDNAHFLDLCQRANWMAGIRSDKYPVTSATRIQFIDVRYKFPNFARHLELVKRFKPLYVTVPDLSERMVSREDIRRALRQAEELAPYCGTTLIVPKLSGQLALLPKEMPIGYSVPSRYGSASYPLWELEGRQVHLLGGSPHKQMNLYRYISCLAVVVSADGNMHQHMSGYGKYWRAGRWVKHPAHGSGDASVSYECIAWSLRNIRQAWLSVFKYIRCPSCGDGLGLSQWCAFCQDARRAAPIASRSL
jgi:hypothetical protein